MKKLSVSLTTREVIFGWIFLPTQLLLIPTIIVLINMIYGNPLNDAESNFIFFAVNFVCAAIIFWHFLNSNGKIALQNPINCLKSALFGFGLYWLLNIVVANVIMVLYPDFYNVNDASIDSMVAENSTLMIIGSVLLVPLTEEVLYRGLIFGSLYNRHPVLAYVISVAAFSLLHIIGYVGLYEPFHLLMCFLQYIPAGICLAWAYARADSIWAPILIHMTVNQIGMLSMM